MRSPPLDSPQQSLADTVTIDQVGCPICRGPTQHFTEVEQRVDCSLGQRTLRRGNSLKENFGPTVGPSGSLILADLLQSAAARLVHERVHRDEHQGQGGKGDGDQQRIAQVDPNTYIRFPSDERPREEGQRCSLQSKDNDKKRCIEGITVFPPHVRLRGAVAGAPPARGG